MKKANSSSFFVQYDQRQNQLCSAVKQIFWVNEETALLTCWRSLPTSETSKGG
uniref:Uncharacterized protein n=1 Tax=Anguilla anguilla TaxID=7936 RepID=A0A0E9QWD4_ANGAN